MSGDLLDDIPVQVDEDELDALRDLSDCELVMVLNEIHTCGWAAGRELLLLTASMNAQIEMHGGHA